MNRKNLKMWKKHLHLFRTKLVIDGLQRYLEDSLQQNGNNGANGGNNGSNGGNNRGDIYASGAPKLTYKPTIIVENATFKTYLYAAIVCLYKAFFFKKRNNILVV